MKELFGQAYYQELIALLRLGNLMERKAALAIERLLAQLQRADPRCEELHHTKEERHSAREPCPVERWTRDGLPPLD